MKRNIILSMAFAIAISLFSCDTASNSNNDSLHNNEASKEISLNDGERWKVNEEMVPHIQAAEGTLIIYIEDGDSDYKALADRLSNHNKDLISSCTMKGESHEQLHHWLHPHLELVKDLNEAENEEAANDILSDLRTSFETYHKYFD